MNKIGITECGDAGLHISAWIPKINSVDGLILITKNLNDNFINTIMDEKILKKSIIHITCTGFAGSILEPNVPSVEFTHSQTKKLINLGFPVDQLVLRIDPIIPNKYGIPCMTNVLETFKDTNIKRIRFSFIDLYKHVLERFRQNNLLDALDYTGFYQPEHIRENCLNILSDYKNYRFESCAEIIDNHYDNIIQVGCLSAKDVNILNLNIELSNEPKNSRKNCLCPKNKIELLEYRSPCEHKCLYCFWRD